MKRSVSPYTRSTGLTAQQRALLDAISRTETPYTSGFDYDTLVGGGTFDTTAGTPQWGGKQFDTGISHAFGRYQFQPGTYKRYADPTDVSPEAQDRAAWRDAEATYARMTGRELGRDVLDPARAGDIGKALGESGEWTSLPGGIREKQDAASFAKFLGQRIAGYDAADLASNPLAAAHDPGLSPDNADRLAEREQNITGQAPQPQVQNPHASVPDTSVNPYGGLMGALGAGITAGIQGFNGIGSAVNALGGLFSPSQQPSVSLPNHPQTPTPLSGIGPVGPVSYGGSLGATGVNAPHTPTPSSAYGGGGYQSTAGSSNPYQGASHPYESGYTPSYSQLAPGAATAAQMFGADTGPVATPAPSFTTTRSLNPNYEAEKQAYNTWQNANVPSMVDSFAADPSLSMVTPGTFEGAFPSAPKPATPAPPKPQQYTTKKVANPMAPSFAAGSPVYDDIGSIIGAIGMNGKAMTPAFAAGAPITDQAGKIVGSMTGVGMGTQKPSMFSGLMSALGGALGGIGMGGNGGGQATSSPGMSGGITAGGIGGMSGKNGSTSGLGGGRKGNDSGQQHG